MSELIDTDLTEEIIERLRQVPGVATLDEAWTARPIEDLGAETPALMPFLNKDTSGDPIDLRGTQRVEQQYAIWIVCRRTDFRRLRRDVRAALKGWAPSERHEPLVYADGEINNMLGPLVWWLEQWSTATHIRA